MRRIVPSLAAKGNVPMVLLLLLAVLALTLGGCGGEDTSSEDGGGQGGGEETTSAEAGGGETTTAEVPSSTVYLTASGDSGVSGIAILTQTPGGVEVALDMQDLPTQVGTEHVAHIHEGGTCDDDRAGNVAPVLYELDPVYTGQDGTGSSSTSIADASLEQLLSGPPDYIDVHAEVTGDQGPPGVACADLSGAGGEETTSEGEATG